MVEKLSILTLIKKHWRKFFIVFFICFGSGLLFSVKHLFPLFFDLVVINPHSNDQDSNQPTHQPLNISRPEPEYRLEPVNRLEPVDRPEPVHNKVYLPMISMDAPEENADLIQDPIVQPKLSSQFEDPLLDIIFEEGSPPITILLDPGIEQNHAITPVVVTFLPGEQCNLGDGHACIYEFSTSEGNKITFVSVHSGFGGEGDALRNLFEGTGINMGLFEPARVLRIAQSLSGTDVEITQGDKKIEGLALTSVTRIPPEHFAAYTALPIEEGLDYAVQNNLLDLALLNQDLLIIETCGWRLPGETQIEGLKITSSSVYLAVISLE
jgi:hypothetical protein